ncbi:MAG: threonine synthase [Lachnospiraceae bacterium]|nr:threonine synthase [Lachnospiraceae bacterium]
METLYKSTRGTESKITASKAIVQGLSSDGGLFVPERIPTFDKPLSEWMELDYRQLAYEVMKLFFTDFSEKELRQCIDRAYDDKFDEKEIVSIREADGAFYLELFHGATIAFKDMALSLLPHLMTVGAAKNGIKNRIIILAATSGDTGKAALAGFAEVEGTGIVVFYPKDGVSPVQELQMVTQKGANTHVAGILGNFDDAQAGVKQIFADKELADRLDQSGFQLSSANSINIGRLIPQICYYVYTYLKLQKEGIIRQGEEINVVVPTGNFGNILAAYYAKQMGLPIARLICASNDNKVLYDFFETGCYDRNRDFILTNSPSMDILISSNLERLIYHICGEDAKQNAAFMESLRKNGKYEITSEMREHLADFTAGYATEKETMERIRTVYEKTGYVLDTHTAVASAVYEKYRASSGDERKTVIAATASPFKFGRSVMSAIDEGYKDLSDFELVDALADKAGIPVPAAVEELRSAPILHRNVCKKENMQEEILEFLRKL